MTRVLLLTLGWVGLTGSIEPWNLVFGALVALLLHRLLPSDHGERWSARRALGLVALGGFFVWELILSNLRVALVVIAPRRWLKPGVVAVPLDARSDVEITTLANLITLTPGTLSVDVSADRKVLFVHTLAFESADRVRHEVKAGLERRVLGALR